MVEHFTRNEGVASSILASSSNDKRLQTAYIQRLAGVCIVSALAADLPSDSEVKAFGMNHSEEILREFEILNNYIRKPIVPGIECVGEIACESDSGWSTGQKVVALMGGMGRSFNGSYTEYALLPIHHVFPVESALSWEEMAAIPETYFTAWGSLFQCLRLTKEDKLLVRGATCSLGYVAIQLAKALGCKVVGTTHREAKIQRLKKAGCDECIPDEGSLQGKVNGADHAGYF